MRMPRVVPGQIWEASKSRDAGRRVVVVSATATKVNVRVIEPRKGYRRDTSGSMTTVARHVLPLAHRLVVDVEDSR